MSDAPAQSNEAALAKAAAESLLTQFRAAAPQVSKVLRAIEVLGAEYDKKCQGEGAPDDEFDRQTVEAARERFSVVGGKLLRLQSTLGQKNIPPRTAEHIIRSMSQTSMAVGQIFEDLHRMTDKLGDGVERTQVLSGRDAWHEIRGLYSDSNMKILLKGMGIVDRPRQADGVSAASL